MAERLSAPHVMRQHTSRDPRVQGGTITHGGPDQFICGFYPRGSHGGCTGCNGRGWYALGDGPCWCHECTTDGKAGSPRGES